MRIVIALTSWLISLSIYAGERNYLNRAESDQIEKYTVKAVKYLLMSENNLRTQSYADAVINLKQSRLFAQEAFEILPVVRLKDKLEVSRESFLAGRDDLFKKSLKPVYSSLDEASYLKAEQIESMKSELITAVGVIGKNDRGEGLDAINRAISLITYGKEDLDVINLLRISNTTMEHLKSREFDSARTVIRGSSFFYKTSDLKNYKSNI